MKHIPTAEESVKEVTNELYFEEFIQLNYDFDEELLVRCRNGSGRKWE